MINYFKNIIMKNKEKKENDILIHKLSDYIEESQDKILKNKDNYINKLFSVLNEAACYEGMDKHKNYEILRAFVMQKTVPLFFKDYENTDYEKQGYKEIHALLNEKFEEMIINSNDYGFNLWKKLSNEEPWENHPTAIVVLITVVKKAEIEREKKILTERSVSEKLRKNKQHRF